MGFGFNGLLEGAGGFGVGIAMCGLLVGELGLKGLEGGMLCLIGNGG
ncbi:hypothetical protein [Staphylococcus hominis]